MNPAARTLKRRKADGQTDRGMLTGMQREVLVAARRVAKEMARGMTRPISDPTRLHGAERAALHFSHLLTRTNPNQVALLIAYLDDQRRAR